MPERSPDVAPGQLVDVWVSHVAFERNPEFDFSFEPLTYSLDFDTEPLQVAADGSVVTVRARIDWSRDDDGPVPFDLEVTVAGLFAWDDPDVDADYLAGWLRFNGTYLLWPYLRTHVANMTVAGGFPALQLQTLEIPRASMGRQETADHAAVPPSEAG